MADSVRFCFSNQIDFSFARHFHIQQGCLNQESPEAMRVLECVFQIEIHLYKLVS
jgi:hypothetical protein